MCTGSGCLLLSLLMELPRCIRNRCGYFRRMHFVWQRRIEKIWDLEQRAEFWYKVILFSGDYFQKNSGNDHMEYDMLISNPPYIRTADIEESDGGSAFS